MHVYVHICMFIMHMMYLLHQMQCKHTKVHITLNTELNCQPQNIFANSFNMCNIYNPN